MKAVLIVTAALALAAGLAGAEPGKPVALLDQVPYRDEGTGSRKIVDEKHVLMMQVALKPGQKVPEHKANSNVHVVVLRSTVCDPQHRPGCTGRRHPLRVHDHRTL